LIAVRYEGERKEKAKKEGLNDNAITLSGVMFSSFVVVMSLPISLHEVVAVAHGRIQRRAIAAERGDALHDCVEVRFKEERDAVALLARRVHLTILAKAEKLRIRIARIGKNL